MYLFFSLIGRINNVLRSDWLNVETEVYSTDDLLCLKYFSAEPGSPPASQDDQAYCNPEIELILKSTAAPGVCSYFF